MARLGWEVLPLVLLASIPGVIVSSRFGAEGYRVMRRRATDARHQNYLGSLLTSDTLVKEVRLFGFERYLLDGWQDYYKKFRAQFVSLLARRSAWGLAATLGSSLLIALATLSVLRRAAQGTITVGDFSLFVGGIVQIQSQFAGLLNGVTGIYESLLYMRNLFEFLELPSRNLDEGEDMARTDRHDRVRARQLPLSADRSRCAVRRVVHHRRKARRWRSSAKTAPARRRSSSW